MTRLVLVLSVVALVACGGGSDSPAPGADATDVVAVPDAPSADALPADVPPVEDAALPPTDIAADVAPDVPDPLPLRPPLAVPADPLAGSDKESCAVYLEERCEAGQKQRCAVYDPAAEAFVADPDPLLRRVLLFERWRDLYMTPDGQTGERVFNTPTAPGTPEEEWARPERFVTYEGVGDSGIWSGWTTVGAVLRYAQTGTEADYARMEHFVRSLVTMYEVTGVPGYLCRYHYLLMPAGAPNTPEHVLRFEGSYTTDHHDRPVAEAALPLLPAAYRDGITDAAGTVWTGQPMWHGRPSIDQNTGPMTALPMAYALLRDEALKERVVHHLTCYLKRLERIELVNLQDNPQLAETLVSFFSAGELKLDPDDIDLLQLDRVVGYVQRQINTANEATFDRTCPATVHTEPWRVIDATGPTFLADLLNFVQDMGTEAGRPNQIDHYYFPSIRGGDAVHLMHLAAMAYYFTGEEQYRTFLFDVLVDELQAVRIAHTAGAFDLPKFCKSFFGDQITYGPWWAFLELLGDSDLKRELQRALYVEMWKKLVEPNGNVDLAIMLAGAVPATIAPDRDAILADALAGLALMGGNGWPTDEAPLYDDPRRSYTLTPEFALAHAPEGTTAVCPTETEVELCTAEIDFMGVPLPGLASLDTQPCTGDPYECVLPDGTCTDQMTNTALPVNLRQHTDFLWQRNPFAIRKGVGLEGGTQYPGSDLSEPYWNARRYGFLTEGAGQVLAWEPAGTCE